MNGESVVFSQNTYEMHNMIGFHRDYDHVNRGLKQERQVLPNRLIEQNIEVPL